MANRPTGQAEAEWSARLEAWDASGLSLRAYALREGLKPHTLWSWKRRLRGTTPAVRGFAPVVLEGGGDRRDASFELVVGGGMSLRIPPDFDEEALARLVSLLGRG